MPVPETHHCIHIPSGFHCAVFSSIVCYLRHIHPHSLQTLNDLSSLFLTHKVSLYSIATLRFNLSLIWAYNIMQFFWHQTIEMFQELHFFTLTEVFLFRLDLFPCTTFSPALCSLNVTKASSGWPLASDLLADIWHLCSLNVLNHKIC